MNFALIGKDKKIVMGRGYEEMLYKVFFASPHTDSAFPTSLLLPIVADRCSLEVARMSHCDHNIFNCDYQPGSLHTFLADVPAPLLIVTTNYDDLIERALDQWNSQPGNAARPYDVVIHTTEVTSGDRLLWWPYGATEPRKVNPNKLDLELEERTVIYKMHGAVDRREPSRDQYVITEDDYIDFLARMTKNKAIPAIFAEAFQTRHFLFLGYGLNDWNLRVVLNRIERDLRRPKGIKSWAIQYKPKPIEARFWQERGVEVYDQLLDEFVKRITSR